MSHDVPDEAERLLTERRLIAHLATSRDDAPHVAPVWYTYRDGAVDIATTGRKLANLRANPRVALSIQADEGGDPLWGMTIRGTATEIEDEDAAQDVLHRINRRYGVPDDAWSENTPVRVDIGSLEYWRY